MWRTLFTKLNWGRNLRSFQISTIYHVCDEVFGFTVLLKAKYGDTKLYVSTACKTDSVEEQIHYRRLAAMPSIGNVSRAGHLALGAPNLDIMHHGISLYHT